MSNDAPLSRRRPIVFAIDGQVPVFHAPRPLAYALFHWLDLGEPEFGAIAVSELLARCRRRLWPMARNEAPIRRHVATLARALENHVGREVHFG